MLGDIGGGAERCGVDGSRGSSPPGHQHIDISTGTINRTPGRCVGGEDVLSIDVLHHGMLAAGTDGGGAAGVHGDGCCRRSSGCCGRRGRRSGGQPADDSGGRGVTTGGETLLPLGILSDESLFPLDLFLGEDLGNFIKEELGLGSHDAVVIVARGSKEYLIPRC